MATTSPARVVRKCAIAAPHVDANPVASPPADATAARKYARPGAPNRPLTGSAPTMTPYPAISTPQRAASSASIQRKPQPANIQSAGDRVRPTAQATTIRRGPALFNRLAQTGAAKVRSAATPLPNAAMRANPARKIGRASCRERVENSAGGGAVEKN